MAGATVELHFESELDEWFDEHPTGERSEP